MDETFSSIDFVVQCLVDKKRTKLFEKAIKKAVMPGSIVLDSGTGSGVMALFAARAGAEKVTALEMDPYVASIARSSVKQNGYEKVVDVVNEDIRSYQFDTSRKFDVVIMEMLTTGMIDEYQVWAMNHLHKKGIIDEKTKIIPYRQDTFATLVDVDFSFYGFTMRLPVHTWKYIRGDNPKMKARTKQALLSSIDFSKVNSEEFSANIAFTATKSGTVNAIYIESVTHLDKELTIPETLSLNGPVVIPLSEDVVVQKGQTVVFEIKYHFGNGYRNLHIKKV
jgi:predicted RNA methylase